MRKNPHGRILKGEHKEQHLSIVPKSCSFSPTTLSNNGLKFDFSTWPSCCFSSKTTFSILISVLALVLEARCHVEWQFFWSESLNSHCRSGVEDEVWDSKNLIIESSSSSSSPSSSSSLLWYSSSCRRGSVCSKKIWYYFLISHWILKHNV